MNLNKKFLAFVIILFSVANSCFAMNFLGMQKIENYNSQRFIECLENKLRMANAETDYLRSLKKPYFEGADFEGTKDHLKSIEESHLKYGTLGDFSQMFLNREKQSSFMYGIFTGLGIACGGALFSYFIFKKLENR